jgi:hypothetical protein
MKGHECCFIMWLKDQNLPVGEENMMGALVQGPSWLIRTWQVYDINGFIFSGKGTIEKKTFND